MPAVFDSASSKATGHAGGDASGSASQTHVVNSGVTDTIALVAVIWSGTVDASGATFSAEYGGVAMDPLDSISWDSDHVVLSVFTFTDPPAGGSTVEAFFSGMPTEASDRAFDLITLTYSGVQSIGAPVSAGGTSTTANAVTVTSVAPAHRVVSFHGVSDNLGPRIVGIPAVYSGQLRMQSLGGSLTTALLAGLYGGDLPGDTSVTPTLTQTATTNWGAIGVSLSPSPVLGDASISFQISATASGDMFRAQNPDPKRTWVI